MNIEDLLKGPMGKQMVEGVVSQLGIEENKAQSAVSTAFPVLLSALNKNAESGDAPNILNALSKHDGSALDNISGFLKGSDLSDGMGILGHILGNNQSQVAEKTAESTGLSAGQMSKVFAMLAPIVMGYLGKQKNQGGSLDAGSLTSMLGGLLGGGGQQSNAMGGMLDMILGGGKAAPKSSGMEGMVKDIGGKLLGGLLGGKK